MTGQQSSGSQEARPRGFGAFLIWLSGADPEVLRLAPSDRPKYQGMGGAVLTTALLAFVAMFFALRMAAKASIPVALLIALVWFWAILNLDRWLVTSLRRGSGWRDLAKIAVPRVLLALLLGFVISTPLVLQIFDSEIRAEIAKIRQEESERFQQNQTEGAVGARINALQQQETQLLATIQSGGTAVNAEADPEVKALRERLKPLVEERDDYEDKATCELTGDKCKGGSRKSGPGPRYDNYRKKAQRAARQVREIEQQIDDKTESLKKTAAQSSTQIVSDAKENLADVQDELKRLRTQQAGQQDAFEEDNAANTGLLIRLEALGRAAGDNTTLLWARILLFLLFTTLECLPIIVKVMSMMGRPGAYDRLMEVYEEQAVQSGKQTLRTRRATASIQNSDELSYANYLRDEREKTTRAMAQATAQAEYEIAQRALHLWQEGRLRELEEDPGGFVPSAAAVPPPGPSPEAGLPRDPSYIAEPRRGRRRRSRWRFPRFREQR